MTIAEAQMQIKAIRDCLIDVEQCRDDVEAFTVAIKCMKTIETIYESMDVLHTLASRHNKNSVMKKIKQTIEELGEIK